MLVCATLPLEGRKQICMIYLRKCISEHQVFLHNSDIMSTMFNVDVLITEISAAPRWELADDSAAIITPSRPIYFPPTDPHHEKSK